jgi:S-(hydroxymethyl)mycothiol dehydrogenase
MPTSLEVKAVIARAPGEPATLETITVDPPGPGEARVEILASGVCHTDLHATHGDFGAEFPYLLGHEATGVVESIGDGVTNVKVGDTVMLSWRAPCGTCRFCARGDGTFCARPLYAAPGRSRTKDGKPLGRVLGVGSFTSHTVVHSAQCIPVSPALSAKATCLIGCCVVTGVASALHAAKLKPGARVAVFGCGAVGVSVIQGAKLSQASRIIAVDLVPRKLEWAKQFGATDVIDASATDPVKKIRELTEKQGVDVAFEAVGSPAVLAQAMSSVDLGGTAVMIGVPGRGTDLTFSMIKLFYSRITVKPTFYGDCLPSRDFPVLAEWYRTGKLDLDRMVTKTIQLGDVPEAFAAMERAETIRSVIALHPSLR